MKAFLYELRSSDGSFWRVSVHLEADQLYWMRQYGDKMRMRILEPPLSYGQAYHLCEALNCRMEGTAAGPMLLRVLKRLRISAEQTRRWHWREWQPVGRWAERLGTIDVRRLEQDSDRWQLACQGRYLLAEELDQVLADRGMELSREDRDFLMQWGLLRGLFQLDPGIRLSAPAPRFGNFLAWSGREHTNACCARCGNTDETLLHWTECESCGGPCPCCEVCLNMGKARLCAPLLRITAEDASSAENRRRLADNKLSEIGDYITPWGLSELQAHASTEALLFLQANARGAHQGVTLEKRRFLIWAVTGAGKTEMVFPFDDLSL